MTFSQAFQDEATDNFGEELHIRISVRDSEDDLIEITSNAETTSMNPVVRQREREFGVVQGQVWQARLVDDTLDLIDADLFDRPCVLEAGFPTLDEWSTFAQGRINKVVPSTDMDVTIDVGDSTLDLVNVALPRDIFFQDEGWAGNIQTLAIDDASESYDNDPASTGTDVGVEVLDEAKVADETFKIVFTTATVYKVVMEDDSEFTGLAIADDEDFGNIAYPSDDVFRIEADGWDNGSNAYAVGDEFIFYSARARTADELTPVYMVMHLIEDVAGLETYDVLSGENYASPLYDTANWNALAEDQTEHDISGFFAKDTRIVELCQDALKIVHGSVFPVTTGQIGLWVLQPSTDVPLTLNGNPDDGAVHILWANWTNDIATTSSSVTYVYKRLTDGAELTYTATDDTWPYTALSARDVSVTWRVRTLSIKSAGDIYINRFKRVRKAILVRAVLKGALVDMSGGVSISEELLKLENYAADARVVSANILAQTSEIQADIDPVAHSVYAIIGDDTTDPVGTQIGSGTEAVW